MPWLAISIVRECKIDRGQYLTEPSWWRVAFGSA